MPVYPDLLSSTAADTSDLVKCDHLPCGLPEGHDYFLTACRKDPGASFSVPLTGPYRLAGAASSNSLAKNVCRKP